MSKNSVLVDRADLQWLLQEVRQLDEVARSMIPDFEPLSSPDMAIIKRLETVLRGASK